MSKYRLIKGVNETSTARGFIRDILRSKRIKRTLSFDATFKVFEQYVDIDPKLLELNPRNKKPYWHQAVRNAAKVFKNEGPTPITTGELRVIVGGGFALPGVKLPDRLNPNDKVRGREQKYRFRIIKKIASFDIPEVIDARSPPPPPSNTEVPWCFVDWSELPKDLTQGLTYRQTVALKQYASRLYRIGFDNGLNQALGLVSAVSNKEMRKQRDRMARRR